MNWKNELKKDFGKVVQWGKKEYGVVKESNLRGHYLNQISSIKSAMERKRSLPNEIKSNKQLTRKDKSLLLDKLKFV